MTFVVTGSSKEILTKKIEIIKEELELDFNIGNRLNGWQFENNQTVSNLVANAITNSEGKLETILVFREIPIYNNYHGITRSRAV